MTAQLDLLLHASAAPVRRFPMEPIVRTAEIERVGRHAYRWFAARAWGHGPLIIWVLLNPSTADGRVDDPTMRRMIAFSHRWGFGSMKVANVYPLISSKPADMRRWRKTWDVEIYESIGMRTWDIDKTSYSAFMHNMRGIERAIEQATQEPPQVTIVAAWGAGADPDDIEFFLQNVCLPVEDDEFGRVRIEVTWHCLGTNEDGSPRHPLARGRNRVPDDAQLQVWKREIRRRRT